MNGPGHLKPPRPACWGCADDMAELAPCGEANGSAGPVPLHLCGRCVDDLDRWYHAAAHLPTMRDAHSVPDAARSPPRAGPAAPLTGDRSPTRRPRWLGLPGPAAYGSRHDPFVMVLVGIGCAAAVGLLLVAAASCTHHTRPAHTSAPAAAATATEANSEHE